METQTTYYKFRKFIYLAMCSLLGVLLFVFLEQLLVQLLTFGAESGYVLLTLTQESANLLSSLGTIVALCAGAWYGVWLGSHWHEKVYGEGATGGFISHLTSSAPRETSSNNNSKTFKDTFWQMDDLVDMPEEPQKKVVVKRVRAQTPKTSKVSTPRLQSTTTAKKPPSVPVKRKAAPRKKPVV